MSFPRRWPSSARRSKNITKGHMNRNPRFIALEGGEGAGKSTQVAVIHDWLSARGEEVVTTREPGGTPLGEDVRQLLITEYQTPMPVASELALIYGARAAHLAEVIEPALARGAWVVCDRFNDASYAYQGAGHGLDEATVDAFDRAVVGARQPDGVLVFDLPAETGIARVASRGQQNRFDRRELAFHERVREAYRCRAAAAPARYRIIDASASEHDVSAAVIKALEEWTS